MGTDARRSVNNSIQLNVPRDVCFRGEIDTLEMANLTMQELLNNSDYEIVMSYNTEFQGLVNYYSLATNVADRLQPVKYAYMQSLVKTLASKHKKSCSQDYRQYGTTFETGVKGLIVTIPREGPKKPLIAFFYAKPIRCVKNTILTDEKPAAYYTASRNELVRRLLAEKCELCGSTEDIEVHHIRKIKDLKKRYKGRANPPKWVVEIIDPTRKSIVVCLLCHNKIHSGTYDGRKLT